MSAAPRAEVDGRGWALSLQRWRATPRPGLSSNLGAAPLVALGRRGPAWRLAARLAEDERLWVSVTARPGLAVAARLPDGRALADEVIEDPAGGAVMHRLARIEGAAVDGVGQDDAPILSDLDTQAYSLAVHIGPRRRILIALLHAPDFDAAFGAPPQVEGSPAVYAGWRLP
jgi:hypothetical protein